MSGRHSTYRQSHESAIPSLMLALQMAVSQSPLAVELDIGPHIIPLLLEAATCFIVLESIANVAKHAHATNVKVKVWVEDQRVVTEIEDDGVGGATGLGN